MRVDLSKKYAALKSKSPSAGLDFDAARRRLAEQKLKQSELSGQAGATAQTKAFPTQEPPEVSQRFNDRLNAMLGKPVFNMAENRSGVLGTVGQSAVNSAQSLAKFGKGAFDFFNPVNTLNTIKQLPEAISGYTAESQAAIASDVEARKLEARVKALTGRKPVAEPLNPRDVLPKFGRAAYESVTPQAIQTAVKGDILGAIQSVAEDPYQLAPLFLAGKTGLEKVKTPGGTPLIETKVGSAIDNTISNTAKVITKPVEVVSRGAKNVATNLAKYSTSQATGLSPKTIETIINNPKEFSPKEAAKYSREGLGEEVYSTIKKRLAELSEAGKGYDAVRAGESVVRLDKNIVDNVLAKHKIRVDENGRILTDKESLPLSPGDKAALQNFIDTFNTTELSGNAFLNARTELSNMAKYDASKTSASTQLARELRSAYDTAGKEQIKGLRELDSLYSSEKRILDQIRKDYLKSDGTFKDNALTKIANLNREGRQSVLARLEEISPGIGKKVSILNALEDMDAAMGQKVGAYSRSMLIGGGGFVAGGVPGALVAALLSSPKIAAQILRGYGNLKGIPSQVINEAIKQIVAILNTDVKDLKVGLSIETPKIAELTKKIEKLHDIRDKLLEAEKPNKTLLNQNKKALQNAEIELNRLIDKANKQQ
jgi:hypothetical protein